MPGNVFLRGKAWHYEFRFKKVRYRGSFGPVTREDAIRAAALLKQQAATGGLPGHQRKTPYTWERMTNDLLLYSENNCKWDTTRRSRSVAIKSLTPFFRWIAPEEVKPEHIEAYKQAELAKGRKKSGVNSYLKVLRQLLNMAYEAGHLKEHPIRKFRMIPHADEPRTRVFSHEEESRLIIAAPAELRAKILLSINTGLRAGEVNTLTWECVDFEKRLITILSQYSKNHRTGLVPLNSTVFNLLSDLKPLTAEGRVFAQKTHASAFQRARAKAGLDPELKFHCLRHTFATRLYEAGVPIVDVKELLRHSSIVQSMRYTHAKIDHLRRAVDLLDSPRQPPGLASRVPGYDARVGVAASIAGEGGA